MRLFLGLPLPASTRDAAVAAAAPWRAAAPRLKWVDPALYHLTLRFLGETPPARMEDLAAALAHLAADAAPLALRLGPALRLPPGQRSRVLALALAEGTEALGALATALERICRELGYEEESRPFRAHLTLARARQGESLPPRLGIAPAPSAQPGWRADNLVLFESVLHPGGPSYRARLTLPLGGPSALRKDPA